MSHTVIHLEDHHVLLSNRDVERERAFYFVLYKNIFNTRNKMTRRFQTNSNLPRSRSRIIILSFLADVGASSIPGKEIPYTMGPRRPGDLASVVADPTRVQQDFGWKATRSLEEIHASAWKWQSENPYGYEPAPQKGA